MAKNSLDGEENTKLGSLPRFGPLGSVITYSCFGGLPLVEVGGRTSTVFLVLRRLGRLYVVWVCEWLDLPWGVGSDPPLRSNLSSVYTDGPGPLPLSYGRKGIPQWPISKGNRGTCSPYPKVVFVCKSCCQRCRGRSRATSVELAGGGGLVEPANILAPFALKGKLLRTVVRSSSVLSRVILDS